ncbi:WYL domain-containing protein [Streptomyces sp. NPDC001568]|uniref:WYL domain-containing protein n=1 Tax=Streptomyces sp. NPDC001568 TaxID=3364588 RepID=UPI0036C31190
MRGVSPPDDPGWLRIAVPFESVGDAVERVLQIGAAAEVLAPEAVRRRVIDTLALMTARYHQGSSHRGPDSHGAAGRGRRTWVRRICGRHRDASWPFTATDAHAKRPAGKTPAGRLRVLTAVRASRAGAVGASVASVASVARIGQILL